MRLLITLLLTLAIVAGSKAQDHLTVATKEAPPFAIKDTSGTWRGLSIELWEAAAKDLKVTYEYHEMSLSDMLSAVEQEDVDLAVAALTVTAEREKVLDFTHPFHTTGLGIAVKPAGDHGWWAIALRFISIPFLKVVAVLACVLLFFGVLVYLLERNHNPEQFGGGPLRGIGSGFWLSAVTMSTVGYGDKAPVTLGGRIVTLIWMFAALVTVSGFTAAIASSLTAERLTAVVKPNDLHDVRVGTVTSSSSEGFLNKQGLKASAFDSLSPAMDALNAGEVEAVVYDIPILKHQIQQHRAWNLEVLPYVLSKQDYAIALPSGSRLREPLNRALLQQMLAPRWQEIERTYLGQ